MNFNLYEIKENYNIIFKKINKMDYFDSITPPPTLYIFNNSNHQSKFGGIITLLSFTAEILCVIFLIYDYIDQVPMISFIEMWEPHEKKMKNLKMAFRYVGNLDAFESFNTTALEKIVKNDSLTKEQHEIELYNCDDKFNEKKNGEWKCIKGGFNIYRQENDYNYLYFPVVLNEKNTSEINDKTVKLELIYERQIIHHFNYLNPYETFLDKKDYSFENNVKIVYYEYLKDIKYETSGVGLGISLFDYVNFKYFNLTKLGSKTQTTISTYIDRNEGTIRVFSPSKTESGALALHFSNNSFFYHRQYQPFIEYISLFGGYYSVIAMICEILVNVYSKTNENFRMMNYFINKNHIYKEKSGNKNLYLFEINESEEEKKKITHDYKNEQKKEFLSFEMEENDEKDERNLKRINAIDAFKNIDFFSMFGNGIDIFGCMKKRKNQKILNYINDFFQENFSLEKIYFNQLKLVEIIENSQMKMQSKIINDIELELNTFI